MIANIYTAVGAIASQEAMLRIAPEARTGLVDMVTRVLKREVASPSFQQSGVIRPRAMKVIDPVICWFRLEHLPKLSCPRSPSSSLPAWVHLTLPGGVSLGTPDRALEEDDGLVGTIRDIATNDARPPCEDLMLTCLNICENATKSTIQRDEFQKAAKRGVLSVAVVGVGHTSPSVVDWYVMPKLGVSFVSTGRIVSELLEKMLVLASLSNVAKESTSTRSGEVWGFGFLGGLRLKSFRVEASGFRVEGSWFTGRGLRFT
eukprot:2561464-Rhodomonas_salina.1